MFWAVFFKQECYRGKLFFSLPIFNKAGFQIVPATQNPVETSEKVIMPLYKFLVDFQLENCVQNCSRVVAEGSWKAQESEANGS